MMKIEEFHNLFNCNMCKRQLESPVLLPCGESLCKKDVRELLVEQDRIRCPFCKREHVQTHEGFPADKRIQRMIELQVNQLDFGPVYNSCKRVLKSLTEHFNEFDTLKENLDEFVLNYYVDLKKAVETRRVDLKSQIDNLADQIIQNILDTEKECLAGKKCIDNTNKELDLSRKHLEGLVVEFDSFEINDKKMNAILLKADQLMPRLVEKITECRTFLLTNRAYKFQFRELDVQDVFGSLKHIEQVKFNKYIIVYN